MPAAGGAYGRSSRNRSFLIEESTEYPGAAIGGRGATPQELKRATEKKAKLNAEIMALRDKDLPWLRECRAYERYERFLDRVVGPRMTAGEASVIQTLMMIVLSGHVIPQCPPK